MSVLPITTLAVQVLPEVLLQLLSLAFSLRTGDWT